MMDRRVGLAVAFVTLASGAAFAQNTSPVDTNVTPPPSGSPPEAASLVTPATTMAPVAPGSSVMHAVPTPEVTPHSKSSPNGTGQGRGPN